MNLNREKLIWDVEDILYRNHFGSGRKRVAKEIVNHIMDKVDDMNKQWNLAHDFPVELEKAVRRFERELGILLKRTPEARKSYEYILEQEQQGRKFERFAKWANNPDRIQYKPKYFSKPEYLQIDYEQAFIETNTKTERVKLLEDLS